MGPVQVPGPPIGQLVAEDEDGFHEGNADAIWRNRQLIAEHDPEVVLVLSADHVYRLDYGEVLARHRDRGAAVTVVTTEVPDEREASRQGVVEVAEEVLDSGHVLFGVATVENAYDEPAIVEAVPARKFTSVRKSFWPSTWT